MQCPLCKEQIDDDSCYCDQCGGQIMVCSECGRPGKGKRCIFDGKELIPAGGGGANTSAPTVSPVQPTAAVPAQTPPPTAQLAAQPVVQPAVVPVQQNPTAAASGSDKIKLTSQTHGIMIEAQNGDIIGRKNGAFAGVFGRFNYVSGAHCTIVKTAAGWHIQDTGSTNGTFYNGNRLAPNTPCPIANNTTIKIADIELLVTYNTDDGGTTRL